MQIPQLFDDTYQFIEHELISSWDWPEVTRIFAYRQQARRNSPQAWVDVLPTLTYFACSDCAKKEQWSLLSAAWSLYILAGRIQDDIQDGEGAENLWNEEGIQQALPTASFVLGLAQMALARLRPLSANVDISGAFGKALAFTAQAQREQPTFSLTTLSIESYFANLVSRTAVAFATASWSGARLANVDLKTLDMFYQYGLSVGIAIQIEDDCRDLQTSDLLAGIYTLPVIYALSQTESAYASDLHSLLSKSDILSTSEVEDVMRILTEIEAFQWSLKMAQVYRAKAINILANLPSSWDITLLKDFALGSCVK